MDRHAYQAEIDDAPREAGELHCPGCLCRRVFWIAEGHEYNEEADLECAACGFTFTTVKNEKTGEVSHQISRELREKALGELIKKRQRELLNAGFVKEDVDRVISSPH